MKRSKYNLTTIVLLILICGCKNIKDEAQHNKDISSIETSKLLNVNSRKITKNDSKKLDVELYKEDLENYDKEWEDNLPIGHIPFPVEKYETPGNVLWNLTDTLAGIPIAGNFLSIGYEQAFFCILAKTEIEEPLSYRAVYSRNHPNYFGQGSIKHKLGNIDWIAIKPKNNKGYAVISGRIFNLEKGKTIFVYQDANKGVDFLQIDDTVLSRKKEDIKEFFNRIKYYQELKEILQKE